MPVIYTSNNRVIADDPEPNDTHVQVLWLGQSQDGKHFKQFYGPLLPIVDFDDAVAWARSMADFMTYPLYVVPMTGVQALRTDAAAQAVANLTDQQRGELRREVVATLAQILRDSNDPAVRAEAYGVLEDMKVVRP